MSNAPLPTRAEEARELDPAVIAAAWGAWRTRHPHERLGPGPGFREAIAAALAVAGAPARAEAEVARLTAAVEALQVERQHCDARIRNQRAVIREWGPGSRIEVSAQSRLMLIGLVRKKSKALRSAEARVAVLEGALRFYADESNYSLGGPLNTECTDCIGPDAALAALHGGDHAE